MTPEQIIECLEAEIDKVKDNPHLRGHYTAGLNKAIVIIREGTK